MQQKVDAFLKAVRTQAQSYASNHIMLTMGGDFHYSNANAWFTNLDKLIKHVNERVSFRFQPILHMSIKFRAQQAKGSLVNVFYSTPTCYARALKKSGVKLAEKWDDFFPYANDVHSYWTGYFTSRPAFKGYVRSVSNLFQVSFLSCCKNVCLIRISVQVCQSLDAIAQLDPLDWGDVDVLRESLVTSITNYHHAPEL